MNEEREFGHKSSKRWSEEHSRGPNVWSAIQGNIQGSSIDKDTYHEGTEERITMKYLKESCYHRIECCITNSLAHINEEMIPKQSFSILQLLLKISRMC